jgi:hypothetical protein
LTGAFFYSGFFWTTGAFLTGTSSELSSEDSCFLTGAFLAGTTGATLATGFFWTTGVSSESESEETGFAGFLVSTGLAGTLLFTISSEEESDEDSTGAFFCWVEAFFIFRYKISYFIRFRFPGYILFNFIS